MVVIGGGQAGLSAGFYLRRSGMQPLRDYVILDANPHPGGAWQHGWGSLRLFSPAEFSSLPGWQMPVWRDGFPPVGHVLNYLTRYEERYALPVLHDTRVTSVYRDTLGGAGFVVHTDLDRWRTDAVISATGTWGQPFWPSYPGARGFRGRQLHTAQYRSPAEFQGQRVIIVGGGNSAAQLLAEVSTVASTTWVTPRPPRFLPDDVDGRVLFDLASARSAALAAGRGDDGGVSALGDIVMIPTVRDARDRGVLTSRPMFRALTNTGVTWADGTEEPANTILWCTGFRPVLGHLAPLRLPRDDGHIAVAGTQATTEPRLHLLGYGDWTGPASATLIGVGRTARAAVNDLTELAAVTGE
ncbi:MAG: ArsO family NAD(P)H-dependent flavin-containing monooxygenase [Nakamurella sp.]